MHQQECKQCNVLLPLNYLTKVLQNSIDLIILLKPKTFIDIIPCKTQLLYHFYLSNINNRILMNDIFKITYTIYLDCDQNFLSLINISIISTSSVHSCIAFAFQLCLLYSSVQCACAYNHTDGTIYNQGVLFKLQIFNFVNASLVYSQSKVANTLKIVP